jgi:hypothetical protein
MCEFQATDIVECIDDTPVHKQSRTMPQCGRLYRVHSVRHSGDGYSIRLRELTPECYRGGPCCCGNCGWDSGRFRLVDRPTGGRLALFHSMLRQSVSGPAPEKVDHS